MFRDLTLFASVFRHYEVVAISPADMVDYYHVWFKTNGLWDFVSDLLPPEQIRTNEVTIEIEGGHGSKLTAHNFQDILIHL